MVSTLQLPTRRLAACWLLGLGLGLVLGTSGGCRFAADGHNLQGIRDYQAGNYNGALLRFQQAAQTDPANADAVYNMAALYHNRGIDSGNRDLLNQAEVLYNQALDLNKNHTDAYRGLAVLLNETDRPDKSFKLLKNWATTSPQAADARIELARLYEEFGDKNSAKIQLQEAVQLDQGNARAWRALAHLREAEQDYAQALANYQRSYQLHSSPEVAQKIASLSRMSVAGQTTPLGVNRGTRTGQANERGWTSRY